MPYQRGSAMIDNYTDRIMLDTCLTYDEPSLNAMWNALYSRGYYRYWHGYVVFLKPLLYFFQLYKLRIFISAVHLMLFLTVFILLYKRYGLRLAIPFAASWFALSSMVVSTCLQYTTVYFLVFLGMIFCLCFYRKPEDTHKMLYMFIVLGSLTSFLDLFTFPLAAMTMPMSIMVYSDVIEYRKKTLPEIGKIFGCSALFAISYSVTWFSKWYISHWFIGTNAINSAKDAAMFRIFGEGDMSTISQRMIPLRDNLYAIPLLKVLAKSPLTYILILAGIIIGREYKKLYEFIPLYIIALMPYIWYLVMANHSYIHSYFTCRAQMATIFSLLIIIYFSLEKLIKALINLKK